MSTLSLSPSFTSAPRAVRSRIARPTVHSTLRPTVRLTRRGRVIVVLTFLAMALVLTTVLGGWAAATHGSGSPQPVRVVTVQPGDTLYDIAGSVAGPGQVREMVHRIQELNSLPGATLQVGQQLAVPR